MANRTIICLWSFTAWRCTEMRKSRSNYRSCRESSEQRSNTLRPQENLTLPTTIIRKYCPGVVLLLFCEVVSDSAWADDRGVRWWGRAVCWGRIGRWTTSRRRTRLDWTECRWGRGRWLGGRLCRSNAKPGTECPCRRRILGTVVRRSRNPCRVLGTVPGNLCLVALSTQ